MIFGKAKTIDDDKLFAANALDRLLAEPTLPFRGMKLRPNKLARWPVGSSTTRGNFIIDDQAIPSVRETFELQNSGSRSLTGANTPADADNQASVLGRLE